MNMDRQKKKSGNGNRFLAGFPFDVAFRKLARSTGNQSLLGWAMELPATLLGKGWTKGSQTMRKTVLLLFIFMWPNNPLLPGKKRAYPLTARIPKSILPGYQACKLPFHLSLSPLAVHRFRFSLSSKAANHCSSNL